MYDILQKQIAAGKAVICFNDGTGLSVVKKDNSYYCLSDEMKTVLPLRILASIQVKDEAVIQAVDASMSGKAFISGCIEGEGTFWFAVEGNGAELAPVLTASVSTLLSNVLTAGNTTMGSVVKYGQSAPEELNAEIASAVMKVLEKHGYTP